MELLIKPVSSNLDSYIKNGASSFLFGIEKLTSFSSCDLNIEQLKKVIEKYNNCNIFVMIDKNIFEDDLTFLKNILEQLNEINISGLFFYDIAVLNIALDNKYNIPLIIAQNYLISNYKTCNYYLDQGVSGVNITTELTKEEIKDICVNSKLPIYVNAFGYQLMAFSKRLLISDYEMYIKEKLDGNDNYMINDNNRYLVKENMTGTMMISPYILDGLRYINYYEGVKYLILNEFMIDHNDFLNVINIYKEYIKNNCNKYKDIEKMFSNISTGFLDKKTVYKVK